MIEIKVYGTDYCPYCRRACALLDEKEIHYDYIPVDNDPEKRKMIAELSGQSTVPQIFIANQSIGGCDDLYALEASGKLEKLLNNEE